MKLSTFDKWVRESKLRRLTGALISLWIASVITGAISQAYKNDLELYHWSMLGLLLIGVPVALMSACFAFRLMGRRVVVTTFVFGVLAAALIDIYVYNRSHSHSSTRLNSAEVDASDAATGTHAATNAATTTNSNNILAGFDDIDTSIQKDREAAAEAAKNARAPSP